MDSSAPTKAIQQIGLEIFKEVIRICEKEDIKYYIIDGTLLGAVRCQGFIPWDDDVDIGMFRKEYEKFLAVVSSCLPEHMAVNTYKNCDSHHYYFSRIVDKRYLVRRMGSAVERNEPVWVDIFPLDGLPKRKVSRWIHKCRLLFAKMIYHFSCIKKVNLQRPGRPFYERVLIRAAMLLRLDKMLDMQKRLKVIDVLLKKHSPEEADLIANFMGVYPLKEIFPKEYWGEGKRFRFHDIEVTGPMEDDLILQRLYGDYMTPPEESKRNYHVAELIENDEAF